MPVKLALRSKVVEIGTDSATLSLLNGVTAKGDVVLAADGIYVSQRNLYDRIFLILCKSVVREKVFKTKTIPIQPGKVATNFTVSVRDLASNPLVSRFETRPGRFESWIHEGRQMDIYTVHSGFLIFNCTYMSTKTQSEGIKISSY